MIRLATSDTLYRADITNQRRVDSMLKKALGLGAALAFLAVAYFMLRDEFGSAPSPAPSLPETRSEPSTRPPTPEPVAPPSAEVPVEATPTPPPTPTIDLPPLARSDPFIREQLEPFALPPLWVGQDGLVQRFAVLVDAATRGEWPRRPLRFLKPAEPFRVIERDGRLYADPGNADRFDADLDLLEAIEPAAAAKVLNTINPLFEAALAGLGRPVNGRDVLDDAIEEVLSAPEPEGDPELVQPNVLYEYADPALEALTPLEKQLLRLGPENLQRLKTYLARLRDELRRNSR
jgi:hypothetical protein